MTPAEVEAELVEKRALLQGHFLLSSGLHSERYVQCARALEHPELGGRLGAALAALAPEGTQAVVSPAIGGMLIGYEAAKALGVRFLFTERTRGGEMALRRGFELEPGERVVVVEDVVTTGKSVREVAEALRSTGAVTLATLAIADRSGGPNEGGGAVRSLLKLSIPVYAKGDCPACSKGLPLSKPGSRPKP